MHVKQPGHVYELSNKRSGSQTLIFLKDLPGDAADNHDGVLCQEVLRALIDRVNALHIQAPCHENVEIVTKLRECLILFETRAAKRTLEKSYAKTGLNVEQLDVQHNGHIFDLDKPYVVNPSHSGTSGSGARQAAD